MRFGKRGAGDWTVAKLLSFVLLGLFLVLLVPGVANAIGLNVGNLEERFDNVIDMLKFWEKDSGYECYEDAVSSYVGGEDLLREVGSAGKDVRVGRCGGVCNVSGGGMNPYRVKDGVFEKFAGEEWVEFKGLRKYIVFGEKWGGVRKNWELYDAGVGLLNSDSEIRELYDKGLTRELVLTGDGKGWGDKPSVAVWANGEWSVGIDGGPRETFGDNDEALTRFMLGVDDGYDDKVFWKIGAARKADETYIEGVSIGRSFEDLISADSIVNGDTYFSVDKIYRAFIAAEHGRKYDVEKNKFNSGYSPWIRTAAKGSGSTAYGPVQMTKGLAENYLGNGAIKWSEDEKKFLNEFIDQGWKFLAHGGQGDKGASHYRGPGIDTDQVNANMEVYKKLGIELDSKYDARYDYYWDSGGAANIGEGDYGGVGEVSEEKEYGRKMYEQIAKKMIGEIYSRKKGDEEALWREWRFGNENRNSEDDRYEEKFEEALLALAGDGNGELDKESEVLSLKAAILKMQRILFDEAVLPEEVFDKLNNFKGEEVVVDGKVFVVGVDKIGDNPVLVFESGNEKYGLKYGASSKGMSDLRVWKGDSYEKMKLNYFPVLLVMWDGSNWVEIGDKGIYALSKLDFEEIHKAILISGFLKKICV